MHFSTQIVKIIYVLYDCNDKILDVQNVCNINCYFFSLTDNIFKSCLVFFLVVSRGKLKYIEKTHNFFFFFTKAGFISELEEEDVVGEPLNISSFLGVKHITLGVFLQEDDENQEIQSFQTIHENETLRRHKEKI